MLEFDGRASRFGGNARIKIADNRKNIWNGS